ncbi:MAG: pirin family protein [Chitinispirillaceae bacterium]
MIPDSVVQAQDTPEGVGARVRRLFPQKQLMDYDPFVLLDEFFVDPTAGFPEHPHRGFEAVTYMLEGSFRHRDVLGNDSEVDTGGVQRFTAGKGLVHSEMPGGETRVSHGLQLWINLPRRLKHIEPSYQSVLPEEIPSEKTPGGGIRTVIGPFSPLELKTQVVYLDIALQKDATYQMPVYREFSAFLYVYRGRIEIAEKSCGQGQAYFLGQSSAEAVYSRESCGFVFLAGKPLGEPVYHNGPYID